jgi:mRNA interferase MazF
VKGYPFEVVLPSGLKASGAVLADQIKSVDWRVRKAKYLGAAPSEVLDEVLAKLAAVLNG